MIPPQDSYLLEKYLELKKRTAQNLIKFRTFYYDALEDDSKLCNKKIRYLTREIVEIISEEEKLHSNLKYCDFEYLKPIILKYHRDIDEILKNLHKLQRKKNVQSQNVS